MEEDKKKSGLLADLAGLLLRIAWIALLLGLALRFVAGVTVQRGNGMAPAFHDRDVVIFYRLDRTPDVGEAVVYTGGDGKTAVGRVVAGPGDRVELDAGGMRVNGYYRAEPYASGDTVLLEVGPEFPITLGEEEYFILFDDRTATADSRVYGPVPKNHILGRVMLTLRQRDF